MEEIFHSEPGTPEFDEMELLVSLVERYEDEKYPIEAPDPISAIKFRMEQQGLKNKDLIPYIGNKSKVSEVLSGKRSLSLNMIRKLHDGLDIPLESLIKEPEKRYRLFIFFKIEKPGNHLIVLLKIDRNGKIMNLKGGVYGSFFGCSDYPRCKGSLSINIVKKENS